MNIKQPLFVCLPEDGGKLFLLHKHDVEKSIKNVEEDPDAELPYSVLGSIKPDYKGIPFLISYKTTKSDVVLYDVVYSDNSFDAHMALYSKPRLKDKGIKITNTLDLTKLIDEYYE